jgi:hypothetical protein
MNVGTRIKWVVLSSAIAAVGACAVSFDDYTEGAGGGGASSSPTSTDTSSSSSSSSGGGQGGGCTPMCPGPIPANECEIATCTAGVCGLAPVKKDAPLAVDTPGDCHKDVCDGMGGKTKIVDNDDKPVDGNACTVDVCTAGAPTNPSLPAEAVCAEAGGTVCDGAGKCVECVSTLDCKDPLKPVCTTNKCVTMECGDSVKDGMETDVDCGGPDCGPCADTRGCKVNGDCVDLVCSAGFICQKATCGDGVLNGKETDEDCGSSASGTESPACGGCALTKKCAVNADCLGANCTAGVCSPSCSDGMKDQSETDVDCGGICAAKNPPSKCADNKTCSVAGDCNGNDCTAANKCCTPGAMGTTCAGKCGMVVDGCGNPVNCGGCATQAQGSCGTDGTCTANKCEKYAAGTACGVPASCTGSTLATASTCDGTGACVAGNPAACAGNFACASGTACATSCNVTGAPPTGTSAGCADGFYCDTVPAQAVCNDVLKAANAACNNHFECMSGFCFGAVCF